MSDIVLTHIGGPTVLLEMEGWRILTDPTFDTPGRRYSFGFGTSSIKTESPAVQLEDLGPVDVVLLTHDHHADNLDDAGRALLPNVPIVVTTRPGHRRLAAPNVQGLRAWSSTRLDRPGKRPIVVTATPSRHGPALSRPIAGAVIGFAIQRETQTQTAVWFSGDSVYYRGLKQVARRLDVDVAILHMGAVRFGVTGPARFTMNAAQAITLLSILEPRVAVPVHTDGWSHFAEGASKAREVLSTAPTAVKSAIRWLPAGIATPIR